MQYEKLCHELKVDENWSGNVCLCTPFNTLENM